MVSANARTMNNPLPRKQGDDMTAKQTRTALRREIRSLKSRGLSYADIGAQLQNRKGKPLGRAAAQNYAQPKEGECPSCLRPYVKVKAV